jgi:hypothetical protein
VPATLLLGARPHFADPTCNASAMPLVALGQALAAQYGFGEQ